ncbi:MAG: antibiotic biosynthesis monooxygenase [Firmicutes bacterium]|nr:antibiotic biosynthesis monooxygenase [Bacillota bacterium]
MLVLNVTYITKPGMRDSFLAKVSELQMAEKSRAEEGNAAYEYHIPLEGDDRIFLLEKWKDEDAFAAHTKEEHFLALGKIKNEYVEETILEKYSV